MKRYEPSFYKLGKAEITGKAGEVMVQRVGRDIGEPRHVANPVQDANQSGEMPPNW